MVTMEGKAPPEFKERDKISLARRTREDFHNHKVISYNLVVNFLLFFYDF